MFNNNFGVSFVYLYIFANVIPVNLGGVNFIALYILVKPPYYLSTTYTTSISITITKLWTTWKKGKQKQQRIMLLLRGNCENFILYICWFGCTCRHILATGETNKICKITESYIFVISNTNINKKIRQGKKIVLCVQWIVFWPYPKYL